MAVGEQRRRYHAEDDADRNLPVSTAAIQVRTIARDPGIARKSAVPADREIDLGSDHAREK
jgi:hypothetical protein